MITYTIHQPDDNGLPTVAIFYKGECWFDSVPLAEIAEYAGWATVTHYPIRNDLIHACRIALDELKERGQVPHE